MNVAEKYTTNSKIVADKDGIEEKKVCLSEEGFLQAQLLSELIKQLEKR